MVGRVFTPYGSEGVGGIRARLREVETNHS